jgi:hypothetical protein
MADEPNDKRSGEPTGAAKEVPYERFGWLFSGGLLATRPATKTIELVSAVLARGAAFVLGRKPKGRRQSGR